VSITGKKPPIEAETEAGALFLLEEKRGKGPREKTIECGDLTLTIRLLSGGEKQACQAAAIQFFNEIGMPLELRSYKDLDDEICWQLVYQFARDGKGRRIARDVDALRRSLSDNERDAIFDLYMDFQDEVDPSIDRLSDLTILAMQAALKKNSVADRVEALTKFGSRELRIFLATLGDHPES